MPALLPHPGFSWQRRIPQDAASSRWNATRQKTRPNGPPKRLLKQPGRTAVTGFLASRRPLGRCITDAGCERMPRGMKRQAETTYREAICRSVIFTSFCPLSFPLHASYSQDEGRFDSATRTRVRRRRPLRAVRDFPSPPPPSSAVEPISRLHLSWPRAIILL